MHASMGAASRSRSAAKGPADLLTWPEPGELAAEQPAAATASAIKMPLSLCRPRTQRTPAAPHGPRAGCLPVPIPRTCPQSKTPNRQSPEQLPHAARRLPAGQRPRRPPPNQASMSQSVTSPQTAKRALSRLIGTSGAGARSMAGCVPNGTFYAAASRAGRPFRRWLPSGLGQEQPDAGYVKILG